MSDQVFIAETTLGDTFAVQASSADEAFAKASREIAAEGSEDEVERVYPDIFGIGDQIDVRNGWVK